MAQSATTVATTTYNTYYRYYKKHNIKNKRKKDHMWDSIEDAKSKLLYPIVVLQNYDTELNKWLSSKIMRVMKDMLKSSPESVRD